MKTVQSILFVSLVVLLSTSWCRAESTLAVPLEVPRPENQSQWENTVAAAKVLNDWKSSNTNSRVVSVEYIKEIDRPRGCKVTAWLMIKAVIIIHEPKCDCK